MVIAGVIVQPSQKDILHKKRAPITTDKRTVLYNKISHILIFIPFIMYGAIANPIMNAGDLLKAKQRLCAIVCTMVSWLIGSKPHNMTIMKEIITEIIIPCLLRLTQRYKIGVTKYNGNNNAINQYPVCSYQNDNVDNCNNASFNSNELHRINITHSNNIQIK